MKNLRRFGAGLGMLAIIMTGANAALITSNTITPATVIDFSTQPTVENASSPLQIGMAVGQDVTVSGTPDNSLYTNYDGWGLGHNGDWGGGMTYVSTNTQPGSLLFAFNDGPVSAVGAFMNHFPDGGANLVITAYDAGMNVLESYNITADANISTPSGHNAGAFRGIDRNGTADIAYFEVSGDYPVVDDLTFATGAAVSVPLSDGAKALLAFLMAASSFVFFRRRSAKV